MAVLVTLGVRLVELQVVQAQPLEVLGAQQRIRTIALTAERGTIYDASMTPLAFSVEGRAVYANPKLVEGPAEDARALAAILGVDASDLVAKLTQHGSFVYLARHVPYDAAKRVLALNLPSIGTLPEAVREYPGGPVAGQVLGFVGIDGGGLSGLESSFQKMLAGTPGEEVIETDPNGTPIPQGRYSMREPVAGTGLVTTIDQDVQYVAESALAKGAAATGARDGSALVLDPHTGDVMAMANWPSLDPARYTEATPDEQRNRVVTDVYEPGSVCKVITASAAIELGVASPDTKLHLSTRLPIGNATFTDSVAHPLKLTYAQALSYSSNIGTITIAQRVGAQHLSDFVSRFGLGSTTGIGFPGESPGIVTPLAQWTPVSMATIAIGQGIAASALQVASVYGTIANDGVRVRPRLVKAYVHPDGTVRPIDPEPAVRVVRPYTAAMVRGMLAGVVEHGTGVRAQIPGYLVGGKTGTARVPLKGARGYSTDIITTFAGMAPLDAPRYVVVVSLNNPRPRTAAQTAAPIFRVIMEYLLSHEGVAPTVDVHDSFGRGR
ncbi:MAG: peptidoglycan D,D-transpeptidase FtsI family protein [Actinomycetota bacterium]